VFERGSHRDRTGDMARILPHDKHGDENSRARRIAAQVSSVSPQVRRRHQRANAGAGRDLAHHGRTPPDISPGGPLSAQNDPKRANDIPGYGRWS
jgi:hypothetical protein